MSARKPSLERRDQQPHALGVEAGGLRGVELEHLLGADREALRHERQQHDGRPLACGRREIDDAAQLRARGVAEQRDAGRVEHGRPRVERVLVVVVAADRDDARAGRPQREQRVPDDALRVGRRRGRLEEVAGDEHQVDAFLGRDARDLGEHGAVLVEAGRAAQRLADVPVGGVEDLHCTPGSPA